MQVAVLRPLTTENVAVDLTMGFDPAGDVTFTVELIKDAKAGAAPAEPSVVHISGHVNPVGGDEDDDEDDYDDMDDEDGAFCVGAVCARGRAGGARSRRL